MSPPALEKLAILGATGRTGQQLVRQALVKGLKVRALARDPSKLTLEGVEVIQGELNDPQVLGTLFTGAQAVLSALGGRSISSGGLHSVSMRGIVSAMQAAGVRRYVGLSSGAASVPTDKTSFVMRTFLGAARVFLPRYIEDKQAEVEALLASDLDWTLIRVAGQLVDGTDGKIEVSLDAPRGMPRPSQRGLVAAQMLSAALDGKWSRQAPYAAGARDR